MAVLLAALALPSLATAGTLQPLPDPVVRGNVLVTGSHGGAVTSNKLASLAGLDKTGFAFTSHDPRAALAVEDASGHVLMAAMRADGFFSQVLILQDAHFTLPAGSYRLIVISRGAFRLTLPTTVRRHERLTLSKAGQDALAPLSAAAQRPSGADQANVLMGPLPPVSVATVYLVALRHLMNQQAQLYTGCVVGTAATCQPATTFVTPGELGQTAAAEVFGFDTASIGPSGSASVAGVDVATSSQAEAFAFTLPRAHP